MIGGIVVDLPHSTIIPVSRHKFSFYDHNIINCEFYIILLIHFSQQVPVISVISLCNNIYYTQIYSCSIIILTIKYIRHLCNV